MIEKAMNRADVLANVNEYLAMLERERETGLKRAYGVSLIHKNLSIFDWWKDTLTYTDLKKMQKFLIVAGELGYNGYVCFKVGAKHCSHGMWAHKKESENGFSPDGECLYHSFQYGENYYDVLLPNGKWLNWSRPVGDYKFTLNEVKEAIANCTESGN